MSASTNTDTAVAVSANGGTLHGASPAGAASEAPVHYKSVFSLNWMTTLTFVFELAMIFFYAFGTKYDASIDVGQAQAAGINGFEYAAWMDTHVMMLIGFGFLYTLLRRYAWSGVSWNYLITVFVIQWAILCNGFWANAVAYRNDSSVGFPRVPLTLLSLINADYTAATVLISFGALLGRVSAAQMVVMLFFEVIFSTANVAIGAELGVSDPGGSMFIHTFGAAFGLAVAYVYGDPATKGKGNGESVLGTTRHNGTFAMIGTLFLFCFWPSFNAATLAGAAQHRAVINTVLSIASSTIMAFALSKAIFKGRNFDMEHIQNATLAGGVAIGAVCDMLNNPYGALLTGCVAGTISTYGFSFFSPALKRAGLTDTCGIFNLHFIPGLIGGTASAIAATTVTTANGWTDASIAMEFGATRGGRDAITQGGFQFAMTVISCVFGGCSGALVALLLKAPFAEPMQDGFYEDAGAWNVPYDDEEAPELEMQARNEVDADRDEIIAVVLEQVSASLGIRVAAPRKRAAGIAEDGGGGGSSHGGGGISSSASRRASRLAGGFISANDRFLEGSVHAGKSSGLSRHGGPRPSNSANDRFGDGSSNKLSPEEGGSTRGGGAGGRHSAAASALPSPPRGGLWDAAATKVRPPSTAASAPLPPSRSANFSFPPTQGRDKAGGEAAVGGGAGSAAAPSSSLLGPAAAAPQLGHILASINPRAGGAGAAATAAPTLPQTVAGSSAADDPRAPMIVEAAAAAAPGRAAAAATAEAGTEGVYVGVNGSSLESAGGRGAHRE